MSIYIYPLTNWKELIIILGHHTLNNGIRVRIMFGNLSQSVANIVENEVCC